MYLFTAVNGWEEIDNFLHKKGVTDYQEELKQAGFSTIYSMCVGNEDVSGFAFEVYRKDRNTELGRRQEHEFLVSLTVGFECEDIAVPKLPDLIALLKELAPLATSIGNWQIKNDDFVKKLEADNAPPKVPKAF